MKAGIILALLIISTNTLGGDCLGVFGPNPEIGNTFGTVVRQSDKNYPYVHDGIDIHFDTSVEIKPFRQGRIISIDESKDNPDVGENDNVIVIDYGEPIGRWSYGHISKESADALRENTLDIGRETIFPEETIGKLNMGPAGGGWDPHLHLEKHELRKVRPGKYEFKPVNPMDAFASGELGCIDCNTPEASYIKEPGAQALFVQTTYKEIGSGSEVRPYSIEGGGGYTVISRMGIEPRFAFSN